jgi:hypothetical protein
VRGHPALLKAPWRKYVEKGAYTRNVIHDFPVGYFECAHISAVVIYFSQKTLIPEKSKNRQALGRGQRYLAPRQFRKKNPCLYPL